MAARCLLRNATPGVNAGSIRQHPLLQGRDPPMNKRGAKGNTDMVEGKINDYVACGQLGLSEEGVFMFSFWARQHEEVI